MIPKLLPLILLAMPALVQAVEKPLARSEQFILVITKNWDAVGGTLQRFKRSDTNWLTVGGNIHVVVGRNGLGRGRGLNSSDLQDGREKKEGDGKAPAGAFRLSSAFGYASRAEMKKIKLPYVQCTSTLECVDDPNSKHYNSVLDRKSVAKVDWKSSEQMLMTNEQYRIGVVVDHNVEPSLAGGGSCIFLHIWKGNGEGTSGCTAMSPTNMDKVIRWLDPVLNPVLVQLPQVEYLRLQKDWQLPKMPAAKPPKKKK